MACRARQPCWRWNKVWLESHSHRQPPFEPDKTPRKPRQCRARPAEGRKRHVPGPTPQRAQPPRWPSTAQKAPRVTVTSQAPMKTWAPGMSLSRGVLSVRWKASGVAEPVVEWAQAHAAFALSGASPALSWFAGRLVGLKRRLPVGAAFKPYLVPAPAGLPCAAGHRRSPSGCRRGPVPGGRAPPR